MCWALWRRARSCSYVGMLPTPQQTQTTTTPALIPSPLLFVALTCGVKFSWPAPPDSRRALLGAEATATMIDAAADAAADGTGAAGAAASPRCSTCTSSSAASAVAAAAVVVRSIVLFWVRRVRQTALSRVWRWWYVYGLDGSTNHLLDSNQPGLKRLKPHKIYAPLPPRDDPLRVP